MVPAGGKVGMFTSVSPMPGEAVGDGCTPCVSVGTGDSTGAVSDGMGASAPPVSVGAGVLVVTPSVGGGVSPVTG